MTTAGLLIQIQTALANNVTIRNWCVANYDQKQTTYLGINEEEAAPAADYPLIAITEASRDYGNAKNSQTWDIGIGCGIINETLDYDEYLRTKTYRGMLDAEAFREQVEAALIAERFAKITFNGESGSLNLFPVFISFIAATIEIPNSRRRS